MVEVQYYIYSKYVYIQIVFIDCCIMTCQQGAKLPKLLQKFFLIYYIIDEFINKLVPYRMECYTSSIQFHIKCIYWRVIFTQRINNYIWPFEIIYFISLKYFITLLVQSTYLLFCPIYCKVLHNSIPPSPVIV